MFVGFSLLHFFLFLHKNLIMNLDVSVIGYLAGFCTAVAQFPQAYKVYRTKDTRSISLGMYAIMTFGVFLWLIYGILIQDWPMMFANGIGLIPCTFNLIITFQNVFRERKKMI